MRPERRPSVLGPFPIDWQVMPLGSIVERAGIPIDVESRALYREIGIRSHGKGIFHKEAVTGASLGNKRVFSIVPNCLVFNIVFAWEGAVAVTSSAELGMIGSHRFPMFLPKKEGLADVNFLCRFFQTKEGVRLLSDASPGGAGRNRTLNQKLTAAIPVPVPPLGEQEKIVTILASVDDAVEACQAVIDQLEVVKKALMVELLTRGLPGWHTRFKQTEIGNIPENWECMALGYLLQDIDAGWSPQCSSERPAPGEWGVLKLSAVTSGVFLPEESKALLVGMTPKPGIEVKEGDLLLARANGVLELVGRTALVHVNPGRLMLSDKLLRLRPDERKLLTPYLHLAMQAPAVRRQIVGTTGGSDMRNVTQAALRAVLVPLPSLDEQRRIGGVLDATERRIRKEKEMLEALQAIKSALMSVLLTGELRVTPDKEPV